MSSYYNIFLTMKLILTIAVLNVVPFVAATEEPYRPWQERLAEYRQQIRPYAAELEKEHYRRQQELVSNTIRDHERRLEEHHSGRHLLGNEELVSSANLIHTYQRKLLQLEDALQDNGQNEELFEEMNRLENLDFSATGI